MCIKLNKITMDFRIQQAWLVLQSIARSSQRATLVLIYLLDVYLSWSRWKFISSMLSLRGSKFITVDNFVSDILCIASDLLKM